MLKATLFAFYVSCVATLTTAQQAGCSGPPTESQVQSLIAYNINAPQGTATITLQMSPAGFTFRVVCLSSSSIRDQYRFVSIVAYYTNSNTGLTQYGQFEFECDASTNYAWSSTGNLLDAPIFNRVQTLAVDSPAINATNRTDCAYCLNSGSKSPPRYTDTVNHCSGCSGCAQPLCYITDTSPPALSGSNFTSAVCCNYYMSDGITCTTACPPSSYPDGNRTCVPCSLSCQNGGVLRNDTCRCNCSGSVVYGGTTCTTCQCQNGGTCRGLVCTCPPGYTGALCETLCPTSCQSGYRVNNCSCVITESSPACGGACIGTIIGVIFGAIILAALIATALAIGWSVHQHKHKQPAVLIYDSKLSTIMENAMYIKPQDVEDAVIKPQDVAAPAEPRPSRAPGNYYFGY